MSINVGGGELKELKPGSSRNWWSRWQCYKWNDRVRHGGVEFVAINTDAQDLKKAKQMLKFRLEWT